MKLKTDISELLKTLPKLIEAGLTPKQISDFLRAYIGVLKFAVVFRSTVTLLVWTLTVIAIASRLR